MSIINKYLIKTYRQGLFQQVSPLEQWPLACWVCTFPLQYPVFLYFHHVTCFMADNPFCHEMKNWKAVLRPSSQVVKPLILVSYINLSCVFSTKILWCFLRPRKITSSQSQRRHQTLERELLGPLESYFLPSQKSLILSGKSFGNSTLYLFHLTRDLEAQIQAGFWNESSMLFHLKLQGWVFHTPMCSHPSPS